MTSKIKVVVTGAFGRVGQEIAKALLQSKKYQLVAAVDMNNIDQDIGLLLGLPPAGVFIASNLTDVIRETKPDIMVDFTQPATVMKNIRIALTAGVRPVVGTTGITPADLDEIHVLCEQNNLSAVVAPNFAIGAVLMMRFAQEAARYFPRIEIIELHHEMKLDAPSGTALKTAEMIAQNIIDLKIDTIQSSEKYPGARGAVYNGIHIHSVRLPGLIAHQEVIFGGSGQALTIKHDSFNRESFVPGVLLAIEKVMESKGLVYGLENLL
ncbi:MAG: 4-hydroxy-tetrahydrodipicolinate reductase [Bacillota bacterium]